VNTTWVIVSHEFALEDNARRAIDALGDYLGGLQCQDAAGKSPVRRTETGFVGAIEVIPEVVSFAFGFLRGWHESEKA